MIPLERILAALSRDDFANAVFAWALPLAQRHQICLIFTDCSCSSFKRAENLGAFMEPGFDLVSSRTL
jgi:hypothetical protein